MARTEQGKAHLDGHEERKWKLQAIDIGHSRRRHDYFVTMLRGRVCGKSNGKAFEYTAKRLCPTAKLWHIPLQKRLHDPNSQRAKEPKTQRANGERARGPSKASKGRTGQRTKQGKQARRASERRQQCDSSKNRENFGGI